MRKLLILILGCFIAIVQYGCSTKIDIAAPYQNETVIYGLLDQNDTAHYIRIEKAFLDNSKSSITMAKVADSSYYNNLDVIMEEIDASGNFVDSINLTKVDLNLEGYPKQDGPFFTAPNYAYKFKNQLDRSYTYRLKVTNLQTGICDSGQAKIIVDNDVTVFNIPKIDNSEAFDFHSIINGRQLLVYGTYSDVNVSNLVGIAQSYIEFNWVDSNTFTQVKTPRSFKMDLGYTTLSASGLFQFAVPNITLYYAMQSGLGAAPANTARLLSRCQLYVYLGSPDYYNYFEYSLVAGTGLTGSQIEPAFTNLQGKNVLGLFTSRAMRYGWVTISRETVDSLRISPILSSCNIAGTVY